MAPKSLLLLSLLFFLLLFTSPTTSQQQNDQEKQTLLQIKNAWSSPPSLSSWSASSPVPHCNWTGIQCDPASLSVVQISLPGLSLSGPFPPSLCSGLSNLSFLDLSNNSISGPFPTSLYICSSLTSLDLSQNLLVGPLPSDIHRLPSGLLDLILSANNFTGDVPPSIGRLTSLRNLYLDNNLFNGSFPSEIANISNLEQLWLAYNPFASQTLPAEFGNLTNLSFLFMSSMNLVGEIPASFAKLKAMQQLDLSMNSLNGSVPSFLWTMQSLEFLYLFKNNLTGEINASGLQALTLQRIDLSMNQLTGPIPAEFGELQSLEVLLLYFNRLSGEIPPGIGLLPSLSDLRLYNNELTGALPAKLGEKCPLWNLEVDDNRLSGELPKNLCARGALSSIVVFNNNFTGSIPGSLGSCAPLDNLQFQNNKLSGEFPAGIWSAVNLSTVILHDNNLTGTLPDRMPWNLTRLEIENNGFSGKLPSVAGNLLVFIADNNQFSGEIPTSLTGVSKLQSLSLGGNKITGSIPSEISKLSSLTDLNLSSNQLVGEIPASIASLPVLTSLDLSNNQLTGEIPPAFSSFKLYFLNLSSNHLYGEVPFVLQNQAYDQSFLSNPGLCSDTPALNLSKCAYQSGTSKALSSGLRTMIVVLAALFFVVASTFAFFVARDYKRRKDSLNLANWKLTSFHSLDFNESVVRSLTEENLIGNGGSGKVYRVAVGNRAGEIVAVKKLHSSSKLDSKTEREFVSEVQILGSIRHTNIVKLLCCISSTESKFLVYEYMKNGSLDQWLHERRRMGGPPMMRSSSGHTVPLDWPRRLGIAIGAARGLCYMHHDCSPPIVHRDVKSSNILLDREFRARIADFGLARMLVKAGEPFSVTAVAGSFGYMAPECGYTQKVNEKMDVYSFGVVLLELTTGREATDGGEQGNLADWAWHHFQAGNKAIDAIDETIRDPAYLDEIAKVQKLGLICTGTLPSTRPTMKEVVEILLRCDQANSNGAKPQAEHDVAPLLQIAGSSRHNKGDESTDYSDDCSGLACNV